MTIIGAFLIGTALLAIILIVLLIILIMPSRKPVQALPRPSVREDLRKIRSQIVDEDAMAPTQVRTKRKSNRQS